LDGLGDRLLDPAIQEVVKAVTSRFTAEELITRRDIVSQQMREGLEIRLEKYGIDITAVSIINFAFSAEFEKSVEEKNVAVQKALTAQRDLERIKIEAEQKIATARAEAESLRLQKTEITPAMVQLRTIQKWDGHLPQVVGNGQMLIDMKSFSK
jgi:regulator of protease activity HflC (stomatin/prohibitin superfamily)